MLGYCQYYVALPRSSLSLRSLLNACRWHAATRRVQARPDLAYKTAFCLLLRGLFVPMDVRSISEIAGSIYLLFRLDRSIHSRPPTIFSYLALQPSTSQYTTTAGRLHLPAANTLPSSLFSFFLFFLLLFSFFSFSLFLTPSFSLLHNQKSNSSYTLSATPAAVFFSALCCLYFCIFRQGNRQSAAVRRAMGLLLEGFCVCRR